MNNDSKAPIDAPPTAEGILMSRTAVMQDAVGIVNAYNHSGKTNIEVQRDILDRVDNAEQKDVPALAVASWLHQSDLLVRMGLDYSELVRLLMALKLNEEMTSMTRDRVDA